MRTSKKITSALWYAMFFANCILISFSVTDDPNKNLREAYSEITLIQSSRGTPYIEFCKKIIKINSKFHDSPTFGLYASKAPFREAFKIRDAFFCPYPSADTKLKDFLILSDTYRYVYPKIYSPNAELLEDIHRYSLIIENHGIYHDFLKRISTLGYRKLLGLAEKIALGENITGAYVRLPGAPDFITDDGLQPDISKAKLSIIVGQTQFDLDVSEIPTDASLTDVVEAKGENLWHIYFAQRFLELRNLKLIQGQRQFDALRTRQSDLNDLSLNEAELKLKLQIDSIIEVADIFGIKVEVVKLLKLTFLCFPIAFFLIVSGAKFHPVLPDWIIELQTYQRAAIFILTIIMVPIAWILAGLKLNSQASDFANLAFTLSGIWILMIVSVALKFRTLLPNWGAGPISSQPLPAGDVDGADAD
ncbi:hypothetical protein ACLB1G_04455 [Oxalobacteraceae bacterium A2-2]